MSGWMGGLRLSLRSLAKRPSYTLVAVAILALGIGANTAIFSIVSSAVLRALPYPEPSRLVFLWQRFLNASDPLFGRIQPARANYLEWKRQNTVFSQMAAFNQVSLNEVVNGQTRSVDVGFAESGLFRMLGARARLGRVFGADEDRPGKDLVAVIADDYFEQRFHRAPSALGATIALGDSVYTVVGVLPPRFHLPSTHEGDDQVKPDVWVPLSRLFRTAEDETQRQLLVAARLKPGVSLAQARAEMSGITANLAKTNPNLDEGWSVAVYPFDVEDTSPSLHRALFVLQAAVLCLLLIACANLANLTLVRASGRSREIAVRLALGASRARIVAQLLTESLLISGAGALAGLAVAQGSIKLILALKPPDIQRPELIGIDAGVLAFTCATAVVTALLVGLIPAMAASRSDIQSAIRTGGGWGASAGRKRASQVLVAAEVALAVVLLTGASLMIRSFQKLVAAGIGFETAHLEVADIDLPAKRYPDAASQARFFRAALERVRALPGVGAATLTDNLPLHSVSAANFLIEGRPDPTPGAPLISDYATGSPNYLALLRLPILTGRGFTETDLEASSRADADPAAEIPCIVNRSFAQEYFKSQDSIGQVLMDGGRKHPCRIVGIVADYRAMGPENAARPQVFRPGLGIRAGSLLVRTTAPAETAASEIRTAIYGLDRELTVDHAAPLEHWVDEWQAQRRFNTLLLSAFAGLALLLALAGIYSVLSNVVASRAREIGIRVAIGARPLEIGRLVLGQSIQPVVAGLALGLAGSLALGRFLEALLFQIRAHDPLTLAISALVILAVAPVAIYAPLKRALAVDCTVALREE
jgi:putative ABC transport system permease protein